MTLPSAKTLKEQLIAENPSDYVEKPSEKLIKENRKASVKILKDEIGRTLTYKALGPLDQMRLYAALGDLSSNEAYSRYAMIAVSVQDIDGDKGPPPTKKSFIEARVDWVGEEGYAAIWAELIASSKTFLEDRTPEEIADEHRTTLKKSSPDQDS